MKAEHRQPTLHGMIAAMAHRVPERSAVGAPGRPPLSYAALDQQIQRLAEELEAAGIRRGERVAVALPNGPELAVAMLGVAAVATCIPLNPALKQGEVEALLSSLGASTLLTIEEEPAAATQAARRMGLRVLLRETHPDEPAGILAHGEVRKPVELAGPDDLAFLLGTSGTTAQSKVLPWTHANLVTFAEDIARRLALRPEDSTLNLMPLFHSHGLFVSVLGSLAAEAEVVCTPGFFFAAEFFTWLEAHRPTWYSAVPTVHEAILAHAPRHREALATSRLRFIRSASSALSPRVMEQLSQVFRAPVVETYGMTEVVGWLSSTGVPPQRRKPGSVGQPGPSVVILGDEGTPLPPHASGEIAIDGARAIGYLGEPVRLTSGWFRTGDAGHLDEEGFLFITGRIKELINRGGEKISPHEIDAVLLTHPEVSSALAFGMPAPTVGEEVAAAVVLKQGARATEAELREYVAARLASFKVPRRIISVAELPKGSTGKLRRAEMASLLRLT